MKKVRLKYPDASAPGKQPKTLTCRKIINGIAYIDGVLQYIDKKEAGTDTAYKI